MAVISLHGVKRHEMGDCYLMEGEGVGSSLSRMVIGVRSWHAIAIGLVVEKDSNMV
jgi:hypothetical protein